MVSVVSRLRPLLAHELCRGGDGDRLFADRTAFEAHEILIADHLERAESYHVVVAGILAGHLAVLAARDMHVVDVVPAGEDRAHIARLLPCHMPVFGL